ncbi:MAG: ATP-binding cassette domain-containing protein, partial [Chitinophagaceae bacterium]
TMKMITGYLEPDNGNINVCGISVKDQPLEIKKKIGYLPEANPLYFDMYIREYLDFIAGVHNVSDPAKKMEEVIELTGLRLESGKKIGQLSKGYKQRVGLAAALIHEPEVLILDEPTTGLDPNQIIEIREVIRNLGKNKTVLFSSHILQEVEALCDRVIIINKGQLVADDSISKLHENKKGHYIKVSFGQAPEKSQLESLSGIVGKPSVDGLTWTLETSNPDLLRKQLMELSLQHNLNIVSLQSGNSSLEDIFRELTSAKSQA